MQRVTATDGTVIAYVREGSGPPLILVHGIVSDRRTLAGLGARLADAFTVIAFDRRGRGESDPVGATSFDAQIDDLLAVIDAAGEPCHVFGHSLGAWVALGAAARSSGVRSLTLYEPPPITPLLDTLADHLEGMLEANRGEAAIAHLLSGLGASRRMIERLEQTPLWPRMVALAPTVAPELRMLAAVAIDLSAVSAPTLLLRGSKSPSMVGDVCDGVAAELASRRLVELPGQDHFAPALAPAAVAELVVAHVGG